MSGTIRCDADEGQDSEDGSCEDNSDKAAML